MKDPRRHPGARSVTYRLLLLAYPSAFRRRFGEAMAYAFERDRLAHGEVGIWGRVAFWCVTIGSTVTHGLLERLSWRDADPVLAPGKRRRRGGGERVLDLIGTWRQAIRRLVRRPGFSVTVIVTLALGIGATTVIFSFVDGVVLRRLPYPEPNRLVRVGHHSPADPLGIPAKGFIHYRARSITLSDWAAYIESSSSVSGLGTPFEIGYIQATPSLLGVLGVTPMLGRDLTDEDAQPGAPPVALITHRYWTRMLGADSAAVGGPILEGENITVVGILPPDFTFVRPDATVTFGNPFDTPDLILPLGGLEQAGVGFGNFMYQAVARLAPGYQWEDAQAELERLMPEAAATYPGGFTPQELADGGYRPVVRPMKDAMVGDLKRVLWILFGAVGFVLLIATVNVANLALVRAETRRGEIAVRRALGASAGSLARDTMSESVLLGLIGGTLGAALAVVGTRILLARAPTDIPRLDQVGVDIRVLGFAAVLSILAGIAFGLGPLVWSSRVRPGPGMTEESRGATVGTHRLRVRNALVVSQIALALVLLVGSGLLVRTFDNLRRVDPGFRGEQTLTLRLALSGGILRAAGRTEDAADVARTRFMLDLSQRLERIPGVELATFSADLPLNGDDFYDFIAVEGALPTGLETASRTLRLFVGPDYLHAIGAEILRGRDLERLDFADQPRVVVVNKAFADIHFPDSDPIGQRLLQYHPVVDPTNDVWYTIVGVVNDIRESRLMEAPVPTVYLPTIFLPQGEFAMWVSNMAVVLRARGEPRAVLPDVLEEIHGFRPDVPIHDVMTLPELTARSFREVSFATVLVLIAAIVSVALGVVGIYGAVSYIVGQRRREFGLRIALGASASDVGVRVLRHSLTLGALGIATGLLAAFALARVLASMLFGVTYADPAIYAAVAAGLFVIVLAASLGPARRAASADPVETMRA